MVKNTAEYNRKNYEKNREKILAKKRKRYNQDQEYAERQRQRSRDLSAKKRRLAQEERGEDYVDGRKNRKSGPVWWKLKLDGEEIPVRMYGVGLLAQKIGRQTKTLQRWERSGVLPRAMFRDTANRRMYTYDQVTALVGAFNKVIKAAKGHNWLAELRAAFHDAWKTVPRGIREDK